MDYHGLIRVESHCFLLRNLEIWRYKYIWDIHTLTTFDADLASTFSAPSSDDGKSKMSSLQQGAPEVHSWTKVHLSEDIHQALQKRTGVPYTQKKGLYV